MTRSDIKLSGEMLGALAVGTYGPDALFSLVDDHSDVK
jgi:hypothetical protein